MNILQALDDPKVFGQFFKGPTWDGWRIFLAALFGLPLTSEQLTLYTKHTGRTTTPTSPLHEAWLCIGRRGGKSFILAVIAVFLACFKDWRPYPVPGAMLLCASSPHARKGALWSAYSKHFGKDNDEVLVWQASTRDMNASVRQSYIDMHVAEDPSRASAEYMAQFRTDIESFMNREAVEACIAYDVRERAPMQAVRYYAFVDPSGGSADSMTLAVGHREDDIVVVDALRERRPP